MSDSDVQRLEKFLLRELDKLATHQQESRSDAARDHALLRTEVTGVKDSVDRIAKRLDTVEGTHDLDTGRKEALSWVGRLIVQCVSICAAVIGTAYLIIHNS